MPCQDLTAWHGIDAYVNEHAFGEEREEEAHQLAKSADQLHQLLSSMDQPHQLISVASAALHQLLAAALHQQRCINCGGPYQFATSAIRKEHI